MSQATATAFFSYSRHDSDFAQQLAQDLRSLGASVWIDQLDIRPGQRWDRSVQEAVANCPRMLVVLSPSSVDSENVMDEVSFALAKKKTVIPVLYRDCDIPFRLARVQYVDFRVNYDKALKELSETLNRAEISPEGIEQDAAFQKRSDWKAEGTPPEAAGEREAYGAGRSEASSAATASDRQPAWEVKGSRSARLMAVLVAAVVLMAVGFWFMGNSRRGGQTPPANGNSKNEPPSSKTFDVKSEPDVAAKQNAPSDQTKRGKAVVTSIATGDAIARRLQLDARADPIDAAENGQKRYRFSLSVRLPMSSAKEVHNWLSDIAKVDYDLVYAPNPLFLTSSDSTTNFTAVYEGWGCYRTVNVTLYPKNASQDPTKKTFDLCSVLHW